MRDKEECCKTGKARRMVSMLTILALLVSVIPAINFIILPTAEAATATYNPDGYMLQGSTNHTAGSIINLTSNDQTYMTFTSYNITPTQHVIEVELNGSSDNTTTWSQLNWTVNSGWNISSVTVTMQLYNHTLGDYPISGDGYYNYTSSSTANTDETIDQTVILNSTDFRDISGNWTLKIKGVATTQFNLNLDWVELEASYNTPPTLSPIGDKTVSVGELLEFTVNATDIEGDSLTFSTSILPSGATFNITTQVFSWTPNETQTGTFNIHFEVSDGELTDSEDITITVTTMSDEIDELENYILSLPDEAFKNNPDSRKNALTNKLEAMKKQIENGATEGAKHKLLNDIRAKMDGNMNSDWVVDPDVQEELCSMIDAILASLTSDDNGKGQLKGNSGNGNDMFGFGEKNNGNGKGNSNGGVGKGNNGNQGNGNGKGKGK
jgi:hypothetical protein